MSRADLKRDDRNLVLGALGMGVLGIASWMWQLCWVCSGVVIAVVLAYLVLILVLAAIRSDADANVVSWVTNSPEWAPRWFPSRFCGVFILAFLFVGLVTGFARIALRLACDFEPPVRDSLEALYVSFMVLGFGGPVPNTLLSRLSVIAEVVTGILFLVCAFPLLIGRMASFKDATGEVSELQAGRWAVNGKVVVHQKQTGGPDTTETVALSGTATLSAVNDELRVHVNGTVTLPKGSSAPTAPAAQSGDTVAPGNKPPQSGS